MEYIIKNEICITKPMVFLCGPFYEEKNHDRRKILKDFLAKQFKKDVLPIIVDIFLSKEKINDDTIKIPLMEELCAAVSAKTYIFLDTFSAVAELGIFSSAAYANKICVIIPNANDKLINNINFFVSEVFNSGDEIESIYYRPRITRVPIASDFVVEYYEFPYNEIPKNIRSNIETDQVYNQFKTKLTINRDSTISEDIEKLGYTKIGNDYDININLRLMFYLITSIHVKTGIKDEVILYSKLKELLVNTLQVNDVNLKEVVINRINVGLNNNYDEIELIRHILKFIMLFKEFGQTTGEHILTKTSAIIEEVSAVSFFQMNEKELETIKTYIDSPHFFIESYKMRRGKKSRVITKYKDNDYGKELRIVHSRISKKIIENYCFSTSSFAYRKGFSILDCIMRHKGSNGFLVIDIKSFFNSIQYSQLYRVLKEKLKTSFSSSKDFEYIVKGFTYKNRISLGFITSPLLSEIYLHDFDICVINRLKAIYPEVIYTRYADDMIFSTTNFIDHEFRERIIKIIDMELSKIKLMINEEKTRIINLKNYGDHAKLLGLNIVKHKPQNKITLGKKYIHETAKLYLEYLSGITSGKLMGESKFYQEKVISGRVAYIRQIEGQDGYNALKERIMRSTNGRVEIDDNMIIF